MTELDDLLRELNISDPKQAIANMQELQSQGLLKASEEEALAKLERLTGGHDNAQT